MKRNFLLSLAIMTIFAAAISANAQSTAVENPNYDAKLAAKLGADERGMKMYVLCILKTGPNDSKIKGKERDEIFKGHFANINKLAGEGKLAVAGPFEDNDKSYRGLYIFNVEKLADAQKLVELDPAVKAGIFVPDMTELYATAALVEITNIHKKFDEEEVGDLYFVEITRCCGIGGIGTWTFSAKPASRHIFSSSANV